MKSKQAALGVMGPFCAGIWAVIGMLVGWSADYSQAETLHYWRFEDFLGYLEDSVGSTTLDPRRVDKYSIPATGPGSSFLAGTTNAGAVRSVSSPAGLVSNDSTAVDESFTIELFANFNDLSLPAGSTNRRAVLAAQATVAFEPSQFSWAFVVERSGDWTFGTGRSQPRELELFVSDGSTFELVPSGITIADNVDYFLSAAFDVNGAVQICRRSHTISMVDVRRYARRLMVAPATSGECE